MSRRAGGFPGHRARPRGGGGLFYGNPSLLGIQALAVIATAAFSGAMTWALLKILDRTIGIRSPEEHEFEGLDVVEHGERAYHEII